MTRRGIERTLAGLAAIIGWAGLALQLWLVVRAMGLADGAWRFLAFFTILANIGTAAVATAVAIRGATAWDRPRPRFVAATSIALVGLVAIGFAIASWRQHARNLAIQALLDDADRLEAKLLETRTRMRELEALLGRLPADITENARASLASEAGIQGSSRLSAADGTPTGTVRFSTAGAKPTLVLGDDDEPVAPGSGVVGRIVTGGRLPLGYYDDPETTAATFLEHGGERWLITGDLATVAEDGTVELLGRGSTSINTGGEKVHPEEVEAVLLRHDDVFDVAVVGTPHERWGQQVTALVQRREGSEVSADDLRDFARTLISNYKVPKEICFVPQVPRTAVSKVDYRASTELALSLVG